MMGMPAYVKENLKNAQLILESLKHDHERALKALDAFVQCTDGGESRTGGELVTTSDPNNVYNQEKLPLIKSALKQIQDGLDDSEVLVTFAKYVECLEAENMRLSLHNQRLCEETGWLRDELKYTQAKLGENEAILAEALVEKRHLEFMLDLRRYEEPVNGVVTENDRVLFEKSLGPGTSLHPSMAASVLGLTSTPNVYHPLQDYRNGVLHSPTISMNSSQNLTMSMDLMHSSLLQGDMGSVLCTQSFHPSLIDRSSPNEPRTSFSLAIPPRLRTIHQIVMQYTNQGKHGVAASLCLQAITDLERSGGRDQPEVAVLLNILALVYRDQGRYEEAAKLLQKVVSIRERTLGPNHPAVAAALNNLAVLYAKASRFKDAEPLCRRALAIREKLFGPNHPDVAKQLNNLALLCQSQGRFEEVETSFRKALDIYLKQHNPYSPTVLRAKNNLASALLKRGNVDDAESLLKAVLSPARTSYPSSDTPNGNTTDGDSAVFSLSSLGSSGFLGPPGSSPEPNGHSGLMNKERVMPLWLLIEQAAKEGRTQLTRLAKFDISAWALEARIELPIVLSALRNLAIVYQRQGLQPLACLLRHWIYVMTTNPTAVSSSTVANAAQTTSSSIIPVPPATNSIQPVSSPRSDLIRDMTASFRSSPGPFVSPKFM